MIMEKRHFGVVGLGVMGKNLALNAESKGFSAAGFDVDSEQVQRVAAEVAGKNITVTNSLKDFIVALERPRRILVMVPAGKAVDAVLQDLKPQLEEDDIVIDGGNSYFKDTERRVREMEGVGLRLFGMGVSGGEEGALHGPSLMPGGHEDSYRHLEPLLTKMAAQTSDGACCTYLGPGGAGHYVKMVHNGIEYGILQLICEVYDIFKNVLGLSAQDMTDVFDEWNQSDLNSYLLEITTVVLRKTDPETGRPLVELIVDEAEQKGTGEWTAQDSMDLGVAVPTLASAVEARLISADKKDRLAASEVLSGPKRPFTGDIIDFISHLREAHRIAVIICYAQGFKQLSAASAEYQYGLNHAEIARIWKGGCIIRSKMLDPIQQAFKSDPNRSNLILAPAFSSIINKYAHDLREVVKAATDVGTPCLAFSTSLGYIDSYRQERLPTNLLQALRDCFGAHTYHRTDKQGTFHTEWTK
jgi:6-phosphogluconate dehydrogenase